MGANTIQIMPKLIKISPSRAPGKKYTAVFSTDGGLKTKKVHFGAKGYGDFLIYSRTRGPQEAKKHRRSYLARHASDRGLDDPTTPAALSYYVTWGPYPVLAKNIAYFKRKFGLK